MGTRIECIVTVASILFFIFTMPLAVFVCIKVVAEFERAVIFRLGRLKKGRAIGPGTFFVLPCIDSYTCVDLRTVSFDIPAQEALTKDAVTIMVDAVVYYRVEDPLNAVVKVTDFRHSTMMLAMTSLRNILGTKNLTDVLSERESISAAMQEVLDEATHPWGVKVERVEIKDVSLPTQLQRAMAAEAEASREARAKVIAAEGEMKASRALKEAADVISESPAALQLRYLQTLNTISAEKNSTIVFPLPIDLLTAFVPKNWKGEKAFKSSQGALEGTWRVLEVTRGNLGIIGKCLEKLEKVKILREFWKIFRNSFWDFGGIFKARARLIQHRCHSEHLTSPKEGPGKV